MNRLETPLTRALGIKHPIIGGAMYPCSNPELVAAVSQAGGIGILQPVTLVYVHELDFRAGVRRIRELTDKPIGMNVLTEKSSSKYLEKMRGWLEVALEEGIRFFVSSLGNPRWIVDRVHPEGGIVYHDVTERKWADKAMEAGVDGLIAVNDRAGGHAGMRSPEALFEELSGFGVPVICAGGVGDGAAFRQALDIGYDGVQIGTRLIATTESTSPPEYKRAIISADESDIVLTHRITGVPVSVIRTSHVEQTGTNAGPVARWLLDHPRTKHLMRGLYSLRSAMQLKRAEKVGMSHRDFFQAGKSVAGVHEVVPVAAVIESFVETAQS
jgi:nitronate monooxygenase